MAGASYLYQARAAATHLPERRVAVVQSLGLPAAQYCGIDPIQFDLIMLVNRALGMRKPPFGVNLFAAGTVAKVSLERSVVHLIRCVLLLLACLMLIR